MHKEQTHNDMNYDIKIENEPQIVTEIRHKILETFKDLQFFEEGHKYLLNGKSLPSVSSIAHKFQAPFDEELQATLYAEKHGGTKDEWLKQWHYKSFKATSCGTAVHAFGESLGWVLNGHNELIVPEVLPHFHAESNQLAPWHPKEEAIVKFMNDLPKSYHLVLNEARVYSGLNPDENKNPKEQYCGTFDMLYWYDGEGDESKSGLVILDYKTNASLYKEYSREKGKMFFPPFEDLYDESLSSYILQLSCYQIPLEDIGLKVLGRKIIWLKPDGEYEKISLPNVTEKLRKVL